MAFDLTEFAKDEAEITVQIGSQTIEVSYRPSMITSESLAAGTTDEATFDFLSNTITKWNLTKGTKKIPVTNAEMVKLPAVVVNKIMVAILRDDPVGEAESSSNNG